MNVKINSGLNEEQFIAPRTIKETRIRGGKIYFTEMEDENLSFNLTFAFEEEFTEDILRAVARDLRKDYSCPMVFSENPDKIYYCIVEGETKITHTGNGMGYITINFRCSTPYTYSPTYSSEIYDLTTNPTTTDIIFVNNGDLTMSPTLYIEIISGAGFSIVNTSNGAQTLTFTGLAVGENLIVDCENEEIDTDVVDTYRYSSMTGDFLELLRGNNVLQITGNIKIQFIYQFIRLQ